MAQQVARTHVPLPGAGPGREARPAPDPRAWHEPGLLRRIEARRVQLGRPSRRRPWWSPGPPSERWTAEGAAMVLIAAVCISLTAVAASGAAGPGAPAASHSWSTGVGCTATSTVAAGTAACAPAAR
jgi:hypothetical protein